MSTTGTTRVRDIFLCCLTAVGTFAAFPTALAPEHSFWPLIWISHVPILWVLKDKAPKQAFWWGLLCGTLINAGGYYWLASMLRTFGQLPWLVAGFILLLHSVQLGLIWAVWAWLLNRIGNTTSIRLEWSAPIVMVATEFMIPRIFPAYMGNSQYLFPPIMQITDIFGVMAVTFLIYRVNAVLFLWLRAWREDRTRPTRALWVTIAMLAMTLIYGGVRMNQFDEAMAEARHLKIGVVEGDVGIFQEETRERIDDHLLIQQNLSAQLEKEGAELIIWSESAYRFGDIPRRAKRLAPSKVPLVERASEDVGTSRRDRRAPIRGFNVPLLFGGTSSEPRETPRWEGDFAVTPRNTAFLVDGDGTVAGAYDKVYLLVFGEYVPFIEYMPWFYKMIPAAGNLEPGSDVKVIEADLWDKGPVRLGVLVCYEGILPAFARQLVGQDAHVLINMTNDDWFGKTAERYLHFALTVPRAIEHRLPFVRSTLTGVSAFVDANGRIISDTRYHDPETLLWDVPLLSSQTIYQKIGDAFPWSCVIFTLMAFAWGRLRRLS
jgi:apolipoprotein N-acyltransferase